MKNLKPITFEFVAANTAPRRSIKRVQLKSPSFADAEEGTQNRDGEFGSMNLTLPVTDQSYWEGRYVLTRLILRKEDNERLEINDATVSISREKRIVSTSLVGLDGTIKEYICNGDYIITINAGIVAVRDGQVVDEYPSEGLNQIRRFLEENSSLEVWSTFFAIFNIHRIVITSFSIHQDTASNRQLIEIKASSDKDYVIESTEY